MKSTKAWHGRHLNDSLIFGSNVSTLTLMLLIKKMGVYTRTRFFAARNFVIKVLWCVNILTFPAYWYFDSASEIFIMVIGEVYSHNVKSVRIRIYSGPYFPAFRLNTEKYFISLRIQSEYGKIRTKITPNTYQNTDKNNSE